MINGIQNIIANPTFYNVTQGTATQMGIKTSLNAFARPGFILMDKNIDPHTKKFSATKEFLYQALSIAMYLGVIIPVFKHATYKLAKNKLYKNEPVFKAFKSPDEFKKFFKLETESKKIEKLKEISAQTGDSFTKENIIDNGGADLANGVIETSSLVGTIIGLAIIAPLAASKLIHPIMKAVGLVKTQPEVKTPEQKEVQEKHDNKVDDDDKHEIEHDEDHKHDAEHDD